MQNGDYGVDVLEDDYLDSYGAYAAPQGGSAEYLDDALFDDQYDDAIGHYSSSSVGRAVDDVDNYDDMFYDDDPALAYAVAPAPVPVPVPSTSSFAPRSNFGSKMRQSTSRPFGQSRTNGAGPSATTSSSTKAQALFHAQQAPQSLQNLVENHPAPQASQHGHASRPASQRPRSRELAPIVEGRGSNPRTAHGIRLRSVTELPDMFRGIFKFGCFNAIQSKCFDTIVHSDKNVVISAPTGSGKTVLFELSMIRLFTSRNISTLIKCIYIAPTKALCSERFRDWEAKFEPLGIKCCEMTGDTVTIGKEAWGDAKNANIIVTTGEKWDSLTRSWRDHGKILAQVQLFLIDEVHILNETRGSTLEVIVSRMKARGASVRFLAVSATVPNVNDVASWVGAKTGDGPAEVFEFGDEFRPCKLERHVYPVARKQNQNDFMFAKSLDKRLFQILQQHSVNKPILVFVSTRNGVWATADQLAADYEQAVTSKQTLPWSRPKPINKTFSDKRLEKLAAAGIGAHNAGLALEDKRAIEELFINKTLRVVVCTSTLAVGVNLPAHIVVIKGVKVFQGGSQWQEYSDLDLLQMIGRAGRPQFDDSGVAIIMCEQELARKYETFTSGTTILESSLHLNLAEHLNSEIGLGTIYDVPSARAWMQRSFMFRRISQNPARYIVNNDGGWEEGVDGMLVKCVEELKKAELVRDGDQQGELVSTEYGDIMSKFYIRQSTMAQMLALPEKPTLRDLLEMVSRAEEISEMKMRGGEKPVYKKLNEHPDIRYKLKKIERTPDKLFILIQASLAGINLHTPDYKTSDSQPHSEATMIYRHLTRIARAMVEVAMVKQNGAFAKHGLELLRVFSAKTWDDRPTVLGQLHSVGEKSVRALAAAGITTFDQLRRRNATELEEIMSRKSGTGFTVLKSLSEMPRYRLEIIELSTTSHGGTSPVSVKLSVKCSLLLGKNQKLKSKSGRGYDATSVLSVTSDLDLIDYRRIPTIALKEEREFTIIAELEKPSQSVCVYISSEYIAGVTVSATYKPDIDNKEYPVPNTRPQTSMERDLEGLENDPSFWNPTLDSDSDEVPIIKDLTKPREENATAGSSKSKASSSQRVEAQANAPQKLPNGKYSCNHSCKDKTACRHLCCREGLDKPPPKPRVAAGADKDKAAPSKASISEVTTAKPNPKPKPKVKAKEPKEPPNPNRGMDKKIKQLNALHERAGVTSNLNIANGKRITLASTLSDAEPPKPVKRKPKPKPDFDVKWAVLEDEPASPDVEVDELLSSEDELPDVSTLLSTTPKGKEKERGASKPSLKPPAKSSPHSSTTYDNSEIDSLIRAMPVDDVIDLSGSQDDEDKMIVDPAPSVSSPPSKPAAKRKGDATSSEGSSRSVKRVRYALPEDSSPPRRPLSTKEPLFLPDSPDTGDSSFACDPTPPPPPRPMAPEEADEEEFVLDESLFNFIDEEPAPQDEQPAPASVAPVKRALPPPAPPRQTTEETRRQLEEGFFARQRAAAEARGSGFGWATREPASQSVVSSSTLSSSGAAHTGSSMVPSVAPEPEPEQERDPMEELEEWLTTSGQIVWT
ncbi:P-loop containing nucleoside triphosphate hydrolase protein [Peniophora sp. CONT]|nr:P-loop containing nucleoside triphosphate hydrolase protein [Peniophora sp. CONT]